MWTMMVMLATVARAQENDPPKTANYETSTPKPTQTGWWEFLGKEEKSSAVKRFLKANELKRSRSLPRDLRSSKCAYQSLDGLCLSLDGDIVSAIGALVPYNGRTTYTGGVALGAGAPDLRVGMRVATLIDALGEPQDGEMDAIWKGPYGFVTVDLTDAIPSSSAVKGFMLQTEPQYRYQK